MFLAALMSLLVSCGNGGSNKKASDKPFELSGTFTGILPAADCSGIEYILSLEPQGVYKMTITHIDGEGDGIDMVFYSSGGIVRVNEDDGTFLRLLPPPGNDTVYFKIVDSQTLRLVNKQLEQPSENPHLYNIIKK